MWLRIVLLLLCCSCPLLAGAVEGIQPLESIRAAVMTTLDGVVEAELRLDSALRMPRCAVPLKAQRQGATTVEVACPQRWRLYVPVRLRRPQRVLVLARGVSAGEIISADALAEEIRDVSLLPGAALGEPSAAIGQMARRALAAGSVLTAAHLAPPRLLRRGDNVALLARRNGVEVRMPGRALGDAGAGERVSVRNSSSGRTIQGLVLADGEVLVQ